MDESEQPKEARLNAEQLHILQHSLWLMVQQEPRMRTCAVCGATVPVWGDDTTCPLCGLMESMARSNLRRCFNGRWTAPISQPYVRQVSECEWKL